MDLISFVHSSLPLVLTVVDFTKILHEIVVLNIFVDFESRDIETSQAFML